MASSSVKDQREEVATIGTYTPPQSAKRNAITAIAVGGLVAGTLDLTQALILFGVRVPLVIAAGLLGRQAISGGKHGHLYPGRTSAFFYCHLSSGHLLHGKPQAHVK
jgi:hypothetical protein